MISFPTFNKALLQVAGVASFRSQLFKANKVSKSEGEMDRMLNHWSMALYNSIKYQVLSYYHYQQHGSRTTDPPVILCRELCHINRSGLGFVWERVYFQSEVPPFWGFRSLSNPRCHWVRPIPVQSNNWLPPQCTYVTNQWSTNQHQQLNRSWDGCLATKARPFITINNINCKLLLLSSR